MKRILLFLTAGAVVVPALHACSSSSSPPNTTPDSGNPADSGGGDAPAVNPNNCVQPGAMGNEKGIGAYCIPGQNDCPTIPGSALLCSGDFLEAGSTEVFCTIPCSVTSDCGSNAICIANPLGTGCAPLQCIPPDASIDSPAGDAPSGDAAGDSAAD